MKIKIFVAAFFSLFSTSVFAQDKIDPGPIKADSNFIKNFCSGKIHKDEFGLTPICFSENEIEIRLTSYFMPGGDRDLILLSYCKGSWDAKKYSYRSGGPWNTITVASIESTGYGVKEKVFDMFFDTLKANKIFLLPNMSELNLHDAGVHDGLFQNLTFKVGSQFRSYRFRNVTDFIEKNTGVEELKNYFEISKTITSIIR